MRNRARNADPECLSVPMSNLEVCGTRDDGMMEFTAVAQFWNIVNDRMMMFRMGSAAKTIQERANRGAVKINDGHMNGVRSTLGKVAEAREISTGLWYRGLISAAEPEAQTKLRESVIDQNSIEFHSKLEAPRAVPLSEVPEGVPEWAYDEVGGMVEVREILEFRWEGIALLQHSSQGRGAVLEVNCAIPFQDLPVAGRSTQWDPEGAAERLRGWAGSVDMPSRGSIPNFAKLASAHLLRRPIKNGEAQFFGQIADVIDGKLVVIPDALDAAMESIRREQGLPADDLIACGTVAGRYCAKIAGGVLTPPRGDAIHLGSAGDPAGPAPDTSGQAPPTDDASGKCDAVEQRLLGKRLELMSLRLEAAAAQHPEVTSEPAITGREPER